MCAPWPVLQILVLYEAVLLRDRNAGRLQRQRDSCGWPSPYLEGGHWALTQAKMLLESRKSGA